MKGKKVLTTLAALLAIGAVVSLAFRYLQVPREQACAFCERPLHKATAYRVSLGDQVKTACCPRCGMHSAIDHPDAVRQAWAADLISGETVPAQSAYYVEGGDIEYCTVHQAPVQREPEGVSIRAYDRCLPTLVAFKFQVEAERYRAQHGGRVLNYTEAMASVQHH